jgi:transcriptional regulator of acetoin/glycerol metabolism
MTGDTGTGKELVARAIHRRSQRSAYGFVSVKLGIPRFTLESKIRTFNINKNRWPWMCIHCNKPMRRKHRARELRTVNTGVDHETKPWKLG